MNKQRNSYSPLAEKRSSLTIWQISSNFSKKMKSNSPCVRKYKYVYMSGFQKNKRSPICRSLFGFTAFYENPDRMIARERASHKNDKQSCIVSQTEETEAAYELMGSTFRGCSYYPACQGISPSATNICVHSYKAFHPACRDEFKIIFISASETCTFQSRSTTIG